MGASLQTGSPPAEIGFADRPRRGLFGFASQNLDSLRSAKTKQGEHCPPLGLRPPMDNPAHACQRAAAGFPTGSAVDSLHVKIRIFLESGSWAEEDQNQPKETRAGAIPKRAVLSQPRFTGIMKRQKCINCESLEIQFF